MYSTKAIAKKVQNGKFKVITIERGWTSENDIDIEIKFCGFSPFNDVHFANYDWGYKPGVLNVAGHEIAGIVSKVGENVKAWLNISFFSNQNSSFQIKIFMTNFQFSYTVCFKKSLIPFQNGLSNNELTNIEQILYQIHFSIYFYFTKN